MILKKIAVLTSGGDAPGMNTAIRAVVRRSLFNGTNVYGVYNGLKGLIDGDFTSMDLGSVGDIIHRGGTILHSTRCEEFKTPEGQRQAITQLEKEGIEGLILIGGDGTFKAAKKLSDQGFPAIGVPATIDNDMEGTEYTIGFDTAVNTAVEAIDKIRDTAVSHERTYVIEVMGREAGNIAVWAGMCTGAESIIIPEVNFDIDDIIDRVRQGSDRGKMHSIIVVAEGVGKASEIGKSIQEITGFDTKLSILGHLQRGGAPSAYDRMMSSLMGAEAVDLLLEGNKGLMVGLKDGRLSHKPFEEIARGERIIDLSVYNLARSLSI